MPGSSRASIIEMHPPPFHRGKIPLYPPLRKEEVLLPPFVKEGWGGFGVQCLLMNSPCRVIASEANLNGFKGLLRR